MLLITLLNRYKKLNSIDEKDLVKIVGGGSPWSNFIVQGAVAVFKSGYRHRNDIKAGFSAGFYGK